MSRWSLRNEKQRTKRGASAIMSSLYDISCFAAGLAGNLLLLRLSGFQSKILNCYGDWVAEFLPIWSPLQATSSPSPSSCRRCKLSSTLIISFFLFSFSPFC